MPNRRQIRDKRNKPFIETIRHDNARVREASCEAAALRGDQPRMSRGKPSVGSATSGTDFSRNKTAAEDRAVRRAWPGRRVLTPGKGTKMQRKENEERRRKAKPGGGGSRGARRRLLPYTSFFISWYLAHR